MSGQGRIRVGIGGWNYEPWRETFYPREVAKNDELAYASRKVTAIEINSTFYRLQNPSVFAKWRDATPADFMFSVKAPRFVAQRRVLADAGPSIEKFLGSGVTALESKLGPVLWQLDPKHAFDADDMARFLALLPAEASGIRLRHALEVRHPSFMSPDFLGLARKAGVTVVLEDDEHYPGFADVTGDFIYARLRRSVATEPAGYPPGALETWMQRAKLWRQGEEPEDLPRVLPANASRNPRDVFVYFINGAKERAPAAAMKLLEMLGEE
ncbi:MAG TPA: DUF72 domain-containing protein [Povalibacter sp.]